MMIVVQVQASLVHTLAGWWHRLPLCCILCRLLAWASWSHPRFSQVSGVQLDTQRCSIRASPSVVLRCVASIHTHHVHNSRNASACVYCEPAFTPPIEPRPSSTRPEGVSRQRGNCLAMPLCMCVYMCWKCITAVCSLSTLVVQQAL